MNKKEFFAGWWFWCFIMIMFCVACLSMTVIIVNAHPWEIRLMSNDEMADLGKSIASMQNQKQSHDSFNECITNCKDWINTERVMFIDKCLASCNSYYVNSSMKYD